MVNQTAKILLNWLISKIQFETGSVEIAAKTAKKSAREYWNKYGERIIKKAMMQPACTSIYKFEGLCEQIKKDLTKGKDKLVLF